MEKLQHSKGFTLIELIAVMIVIVILAWALIPRIGNMRYQAKKAYDEQTVIEMGNALERSITDGSLTTNTAPVALSVINYSNSPVSQVPYLSQPINNATVTMTNWPNYTITLTNTDGSLYTYTGTGIPENNTNNLVAGTSGSADVSGGGTSGTGGGSGGSSGSAGVGGSGGSSGPTEPDIYGLASTIARALDSANNSIAWGGYPDYWGDPTAPAYQLTDWSTAAVLSWIAANANPSYVTVPTLPDGITMADITIVPNLAAPDVTVIVTWPVNGDTQQRSMSNFGSD